ncbi:MAG: lipid IV(A) 3-deoxy-D-manno-octulosonic acid transferase [Gammaproteobacteria bacterium]|nr:lipid IV(A) 3-deoxy-D-manno-octulosonic acid transferase [Gammaproteobacteria bacterium]
MIRLIYSVVFYLAVPLLLLRLLYRSLKAPAYGRRWAERFSFIDLPKDFKRTEKSIWVHAVSVGETQAAVPLIKNLLRNYPDKSIVVTTMTPTGSERVRVLFGDSVFHTYIPYDLPGAMGRFIHKINPGVLIIMETELWPNVLHQCHKAGVRTILANARMSEKSANGYRRISSITRKMLGEIDCIAAQAEADSIRFVELGADKEKVSVTGSLKFEIEPPDIKIDNLPNIFRQIKQSNRPVLIAASTREGEEKKIIAAFRQCLEQEPTLLLELVPRHPERFNAVARLCDEHHLELVRRSSEAPVTAQTQVLLGDSMGEMWFYFSVADIAFVGGSLVNTGCQNVLEPAALGIPVLVGPSQFNFETICNQLREAGALVTVENEQDLAGQVLQLLGDPRQRSAMGTAGKGIVESNKGSLGRLTSVIEQQLGY